MKFPNWKKPERNAQLSEQEIKELISTANNEGTRHQVPGQPVVQEVEETYHDGNTWKDEYNRERRYEDD